MEYTGVITYDGKREESGIKIKRKGMKKNKNGRGFILRSDRGLRLEGM